jgi:hypothetical protein
MSLMHGFLVSTAIVVCASFAAPAIARYAGVEVKATGRSTTDTAALREAQDGHAQLDLDVLLNAHL